MTNTKSLEKLIQEYDNELKLSLFAKRQIKDGIIRHNINPDILFEIAEKKRRNTFKKIKPQEVRSIFLGNIQSFGIKNSYFKFNNNKAVTIKDYVAIRDKSEKLIKVECDTEADIENSDDFIKQFLNICYIAGGFLKKGLPDYGYYCLIKLKNNLIYHIKYDKEIGYNSTWLMYVYMLYHQIMFNKEIKPVDKNQKLHELVNRSKESKKLYKYLKDFYDDIDFIYGVMAHLNSNKKVELFLLMLEKNEGASGHMPMNNAISFMTEADYLSICPDDYKPKFIRDEIEEQLKDETSTKLYKKLQNIFKYEVNIQNIMILLKTKENMQEMIKFLNTGETNVDKIHYKVADIVRNEKRRKK